MAFVSNCQEWFAATTVQMCIMLALTVKILWKLLLLVAKIRCLAGSKG
jgi:hypothetical protein